MRNLILCGLSFSFVLFSGLVFAADDATLPRSKDKLLKHDSDGTSGSESAVVSKRTDQETNKSSTQSVQSTQSTCVQPCERMARTPRTRTKAEYSSSEPAVEGFYSPSNGTN